MANRTGVWFFSLSVKAGWKGTISGLDGLGWIVLAIVIFGAWNPVRAALGAYLFGLLQWLSVVLQPNLQGIPSQVLQVAPFPLMILTLLLVFVIPRFQTVFEGLLNGRQMPAFTLAVLNISNAFKSHFLAVGMLLLVLFAAFQGSIRTRPGRRTFDRFKLAMPVLGKVCRKVSLSRFTRTLGTLLGSGVPILQALTIVKETAGNVVVGGVISRIHDNVQEGGTLAEPLRTSGLFPAMIGGMVDVGEQTGALPDMLLKIADTADEEVDAAVTAMTSLLEPVMIIFLAIVVGSIVIAMFLPLIYIMQDPNIGGGGGGEN